MERSSFYVMFENELTLQQQADLSFEEKSECINRMLDDPDYEQPPATEMS